MIKAKAYWVKLGSSNQPAANVFFIIDITCLWFKSSICFHIHLKNVEPKPKNGMIIEHGWGEANVAGYQVPEHEVREIY